MARLGPLVIRLALGAIFFAHGAQKMLGWWGGAGFSGTVEAFGKNGMAAPPPPPPDAAGVFRGGGPPAALSPAPRPAIGRVHRSTPHTLSSPIFSSRFR